MGDSASKAPCKVELSPSGDGQKSVISAPLDEFLTAEKFWELYEKQSRAGYTMPTVGKLFGGGVKNHEVKDLEDGSFQVSELISGGMLGAGDVNLNLHHSFNKERQEWYTHRYLRSFTDDDLQEKTTIRLHHSPLVVESWLEAAHTQQGDESIKGLAESLMKEVLSRAGASNTTLAFTADADAITNPGKKSAVSEEIKEPLTQAALLEHFAAYVRDGVTKPDKTDHQVQDLPRGNFVVVDTFSSGTMTYEKVMISEEAFAFDLHAHEDDPDLTDVSCNESYHARFLGDPLRVEFWREGRPGRKVSRELLKIIQNAIDTSIAEAAG